MRYIDAEKLKSEIEKLLAKAKNDEEKAFAKKDAAGHLVAVTKTAVCVKIKKIIDSLQQEQPEVDLEKEITRWLCEGDITDTNFDDYDDDDIERTARHFYELGRISQTK